MHIAHSSVKCNTVTNVGKKLRKESFSEDREAPSMRPCYRLFIVLTASCERDAGSFDDASDGWDRFLDGYLATVDQLVVG